MEAKFNSYNQIMGALNEELESRKIELEWYKFRIKQLSTRPSMHPL
ncbi:MAG: hypothetical protein JW791_00505 [Nanoarchaeota archaeon]|nr:hypothetical protein [Nanoarchaeota archaeon]